MKQLSSRKRKVLSKPWITTGLKVSIRMKNKLYPSGDEVRYKYYRNKISNLLRISKKNYYSDYFEANMPNIKKTWTGINELLFCGRKILRLLLKTIKINQSRIRHIFLTLSMTILCLLGVNSHVRFLPLSQQHYLDFVNKNMFPMPSFFFQPLTYDCVKTEILSLPSNKSHGLYSSPTKLLKCSINIVAPVLSEVFKRESP